MAVGDGGVSGEQKHSGEFAQDGAAANDEGVQSGGIDAVGVEDVINSCRGAGVKSLSPEGHRGE